ncbi:TIGR02281 family clan AA aspartic protease [Caenimonas sedimenti]|uniref:TIGR02281 family clan AA aspartic protease n=1 Tax=Caenimonas sedimenti TaxID=2596921 RepID=A0A562ZWG5_9BURK|nr:TIGR02281 family clan AA aspartic protease [Caenimonas sedimenti]TWO72962.1 TIGR02281 family clan AA aspartic protease [Caenimonas sedimenti]
MRLLCAALLALTTSVAGAQTVALQGTLGSKALLIVDGSAPKSLGAGETHQGVKVLSVTGDQAVVEIAGKRVALRVGDAPASVGGAPVQGGKRIVLAAGTGGHFVTAGQINGKSVQFMVDTGATAVAMTVSEAQRLGIDYRKGTIGQAGTANGVVQIWTVKLASVRIGDVEIYDVDAAVVPASMPYVLLGNSFLGRFQMRRDNDTMVLERRY